MPEQRPKYTKDEEPEDIYGTPVPGAQEREKEVITEKEFIEKEVKVPQKQAMPRPEDEIDSIKRITPEIIGGLFERVRFLEERIEDIRSTMEDRKELHVMMLKEIDEEIAEKKVVESKLTDLEDKRNLKLDISMLRRDKRNELVRYWKDMYELRSELKELTERHEVEKKVAGIFERLDTKKV